MKRIGIEYHDTTANANSCCLHRMDSPRLKEIKEHDIQTHHAPHMEEAPWLAIPMKAARELLAGYDLTEDEKNNLPAMMAGYCRLLDESGMTFEGDSEREVQDAALDFCRSDKMLQEAKPEVEE